MICVDGTGVTRAMARILDITEEKYLAPDKEETAFWQLSLFWRGFLFRAWHCEANKGVSSTTCKDLLSSRALVFTVVRFSKTILELIFRKGCPPVRVRIVS